MTYSTKLAETLVPSRIVEPTSWIGHIPFAYFLVENYKPRRIVELGVHTGNSFFAFCDAVKALSLHCICIGVDTFEGDEHAGFYGPKVLKDVSDHIDKTYPGMDVLLSPCTFDGAVGAFENGSIDILHIDGCHTYEQTKHNYETWLPKMSPDGIILFHDIFIEREGFGVKQLWNEIYKENDNFKYRTISFRHSCGLGVLFLNQHMKPTEEKIDKGNVPLYFEQLGDNIQRRHDFKTDTKITLTEAPKHKLEGFEHNDIPITGERVKVGPSICLAFICRDNEDVVGRMIDSCAPIVSYVVACDTGSKDNTIQVITNKCANLGLSCDIHLHEWKNFGHNRSLLMKEVPKIFNYTLVMDTDETLEILPEFNITDLKEDCIMINTFDTNNVWARDRIFSNLLNWEWYGAAHEFPGAKGMQTKRIEENLRLKIYPKKPGENNILRNYNLLLEDYNNGKQKDTRTLFYLGESCSDLGRYEEAYNWYMQRAMFHEIFPEERWYALYKAALMLAAMGKPEEATAMFLKAYGIRPHRMEPLYDLAMMLTKQNRHSDACTWFEIAVKIPYPKDDYLFVRKALYDFDCMFQYSVALFYSGQNQKAWNACELLTTYDDLPEPIRNQNLLNLTYVERALIKDGWRERFVVSPPDLRYDGLGDHLLYGHIAELAHKFGFKKIYLSSFAKFKTPGTKELVYLNNPVIEGEIERYCPYQTDDLAVQVCNGNIPAGMEFMKAIALSYGFYEEGHYYEPEPYFPKNREHMFTHPEILFDGYGKTNVASEEKVMRYFAKFGMPSHQITIDNTESDIHHSNSTLKRVYLPGVPEIHVKDIYEYADAIMFSKSFICLTSASAILAETIANFGARVLTETSWLAKPLAKCHMRPGNEYINLDTL